MEPKSLFKYEKSHAIFEQLSAISPDEGTRTYWKWFCALNEIPRPSHHTEAVIAWVCDIATKMGLSFKKDAFGNVCVYVPATAGYESKPSICVQGHVDMVGTLAAGVQHDWAKDPIEMKLENGVLSACGTTLGGDDGAGVACLLAYMELRDKFKHPQLECLFTVDEEVGCLGASALVEGELLTSKCKYLMNIDSEDWGEVTISSAGTAMRLAKVPMRFCDLDAEYVGVDLVIEKFAGGHSGVEIHHQRVNALKWIVDLLLFSAPILPAQNTDFHIVKFDAGHAHNAIPSHASALLAVKADVADQLIEEIKKNHQALTLLYRNSQPTEPVLKLQKTSVAAGTHVLTRTSSFNLLTVLQRLPHGVLKFSDDVENLVETSQSVSIAKLTDTTLNITLFARSNRDDLMDLYVKANIDMLTCLGATVEVPCADACGWPAEPNTHLLDMLKKTYKELFGSEIKTTAIHAGLENSIIMAKYKSLNLESFSIGPSVHDVHTPMEHIICDTAQKCFFLLQTLIERL